MQIIGVTGIYVREKVTLEIIISASYVYEVRILRSEQGRSLSERREKWSMARD